MKKEQITGRKASLASSRSSAIKEFLTVSSSHLSLQPIHVLILSLCFIGNIILLHIIGRFGSSIRIQTVISIVAVAAALVLGYLVRK